MSCRIDLTEEKLAELLAGFAESIRVQLRARPLGVDVPERWIQDLANNMVGGLPAYADQSCACSQESCGRVECVEAGRR